jgi:hypothetical protein
MGPQPRPRLPILHHGGPKLKDPVVPEMRKIPVLPIFWTVGIIGPMSSQGTILIPVIFQAAEIKLVQFGVL